MRVTHHVEGATRGHLLWWLATFSIVWACLTWIVPSFDHEFTEIGVSLPDATEAVVAVSSFAATPLGGAFGVAVIVGSIALYRRARHRPALRRALVALTLLNVAAVPVSVVALFMPMIQTCQKL